MKSFPQILLPGQESPMDSHNRKPNHTTCAGTIQHQTQKTEKHYCSNFFMMLGYEFMGYFFLTRIQKKREDKIVNI